jgi:hypothetical protein
MIHPYIQKPIPDDIITNIIAAQLEGMHKQGVQTTYYDDSRLHDEHL